MIEVSQRLIGVRRVSIISVVIGESKISFVSVRFSERGQIAFIVNHPRPFPYGTRISCTKHVCQSFESSRSISPLILTHGPKPTADTALVCCCGQTSTRSICSPRIPLHPIQSIKVLDTFLREVLDMLFRQRIVFVPICGRKFSDLIPPVKSHNQPVSRYKHPLRSDHTYPHGFLLVRHLIVRRPDIIIKLP